MKKLLALFVLIPVLVSAQSIQRNSTTTNGIPVLPSGSLVTNFALVGTTILPDGGSIFSTGGSLLLVPSLSLTIGNTLNLGGNALNNAAIGGVSTVPAADLTGTIPLARLPSIPSNNIVSVNASQIQGAIPFSLPAGAAALNYSGSGILSNVIVDFSKSMDFVLLVTNTTQLIYTNVTSLTNPYGSTIWLQEDAVGNHIVNSFTNNNTLPAGQPSVNTNANAYSLLYAHEIISSIGATTNALTVQLPYQLPASVLTTSSSINAATATNVVGGLYSTNNPITYPNASPITNVYFYTTTNGWNSLTNGAWVFSSSNISLTVGWYANPNDPTNWIAYDPNNSLGGIGWEIDSTSNDVDGSTTAFTSGLSLTNKFLWNFGPNQGAVSGIQAYNGTTTTIPNNGLWASNNLIYGAITEARHATNADNSANATNSAAARESTSPTVSTSRQIISKAPMVMFSWSPDSLPPTTQGTNNDSSNYTNIIRYLVNSGLNGICRGIDLDDPTIATPWLTADAVNYAHSNGLFVCLWTLQNCPRTNNMPDGASYTETSQSVWSNAFTTYINLGVDEIKLDQSFGVTDFGKGWNDQDVSQWMKFTIQCISSRLGKFVHVSVKSNVGPFQPWLSQFSHWDNGYGSTFAWPNWVANFVGYAGNVGFAGNGSGFPFYTEIKNFGGNTTNLQGCLSGLAIQPIRTFLAMTNWNAADIVLLTNADWQSIYQDPAGIAGTMVFSNTIGNNEVTWVRPMQNGDWAVYFGNMNKPGSVTNTINWITLGLPATTTMNVRDVWAQTNSVSTGSFSYVTSSNSATLFRVSLATNVFNAVVANSFSGDGSRVTGIPISALSSTSVSNNAIKGATISTNVVVYTVPAGVTNTYEVGGFVNVTAVAVDVVNFQVLFTDENNASQTLALDANITATGFNTITTQGIRCKGGTTISLKGNLVTGTGSITYDIGGFVKPVL